MDTTFIKYGIHFRKNMNEKKFLNKISKHEKGISEFDRSRRYCTVATKTMTRITKSVIQIRISRSRPLWLISAEIDAGTIATARAANPESCFLAK